MALNSTITIKKIDGKEEEVLNIEFTNGTLKQLKDLGLFLEKDGFPFPDDTAEKMKAVISVAIGWLEGVKERREKEQTSTK